MKLMRRKKTLLGLGLFIVGAGVAVSLAFPSIVKAGICWQGWQCDTGYFYGKGAATGTYPSEYDDVFTAGIPSNVTNLSTFVAFLSSNLKCTTTDQPSSALGVAQSNQNATGSAFIILTMLGAPPKTAKNQACVRWTEWKNLFTSYDQAGLVNYSVNTPLNDLDTYYMPDFGGDIGFTRGTPPGATITVYKADKSGPIYIIRRSCGNPIGTITGLPALTNNGGSGGTGDVNPAPPGGGGSNGNYSNNAVDSTQYSSCQTISGHAFDPSAPSYAVQVTITFSIGGPPLTTTASTSGTHLYQVDTPDAVRNSLVPIVVTAVGKAANGTQFLLANSPITIGPCLVITGSCVNASTTPAVPDPNAPYNLTATVQYGNSTQAALVSAQPDFRFFVTVRGPDGPTVIYNNPAVANAVRSGNQITVEIDNMAPLGTPGTYTIGWGVTGTYGAVNCGSSIPGNSSPPTVSALNKPYFSVHGADVSAGASISPATGPTCPASGPSGTNSMASVVGWNVDPANGNYGGAGADFAAFALNHIQEFATAQGSTTIPVQPSGLSFANSGLAGGDLNPTGGLYGGKFGGSSCVGNFFAKAPSTVPGGVLSGLPGFPANGNVPNGAHLIYYVDGDLVIDSNVRFSTTYARTGDVPTFAVVVKGNIYIRPNVSQLDGFYIAQASNATATNGIIMTCAPQDAATTADTILKKELQNSCNNQLTVNGAFLGRQVWLLRSAGTLTTTPAEIFNYVPDVWLTAPFGSGLSTDFSDYDAITSLPPVL